MKNAVSLVAAILAATLAACAGGRPQAPQEEQEAADASEAAGKAANPEHAPAAKPSDARNFTLGEFAATALHDGDVTFPNDNKVFGVGHTPAEVAQLLSSAGQPTDKLALSVQPLLLRTADHVMLFDTGAGANFGPSAGRLLQSMAETGFAPVTVTDIFISHSHGDHVGGLVNAAGELNFPNAVIHISAPEWAYLKGLTPQDAKNIGISNHAAMIAAITPKIAEFAPDSAVVPGIVKAVAIRGHTPGHTGYLITARRVSLLYVGDAVHHFVVSLRKPQWPNAFDGDRETAEASRSNLLSDLAQSGQLVYAGHFPFPGLGKIQRQGDGYVWVPK
ncbi:MAG TPA: MBL fold metallo-hydrolase [Steroidobacteraceae bacterium]|jgi:glyoxylase-like metal-dependent hydrolase (beta-lactamase superfamily II)|nr:MBL fold metallo-hydrolase [Steroidobacteraceae bacterium]HJY36796.1 MBL fold metallo-hydrolase [Steroidobacteraceae bacterium]